MEKKKSEVLIRMVTADDLPAVENLTREAFWNVHEPGCTEHYLVHIMQQHPDFIPELSFVAEEDWQIIGNIMYTKAKLIDECGKEKEILTFGPLSVLPGKQRMGIGKKLMETSFEKALPMGYDTVAIFGHPGNYVSSGFKSCKKYQICLEEDFYPTALLIKELKPGVLSGHKWQYRESQVYELDEKEAEQFDRSFPPKEKGYQKSQEEFFTAIALSMDKIKDNWKIPEHESAGIIFLAKNVDKIVQNEYNNSTKKGSGDMSITATELKNNLGKYLLLSATEDVFITKNGKIVAKLTNPHQDRVEVAKSLFGILPKDADLNAAKEERLGAK